MKLWPSFWEAALSPIVKGRLITKPDPRYYEQIAQLLGVNPHQCIMVGDRIDKNIIPVKQVGMKTIWTRVGLHKNQVLKTLKFRLSPISMKERAYGSLKEHYITLRGNPTKEKDWDVLLN